ncbi:hypothetical protein [Pasteuria penetrans]|uniref:hypothetical protein n=1 Tax=Pasteuria penetrans TaxID=86005 RepID=UPI0011ED2A29|nr:hypothetical protein [Pasteuria penetrans]
MAIFDTFHDYFLYVTDRVFWLHHYRQQCSRMVQQKGVPKWSWYVLRWLGLGWFLLTMAVFLWIWESSLVLTLGVAGWVTILKWQIHCENRWCGKESQNKTDPRFVNISLFLFLCYPLPLHLYQILFEYFDISNEDFSPTLYSFLCLIYIQLIFPVWFHLLLGKRAIFTEYGIKSRYHKNNKGDPSMFLGGLIYYDDFGGMLESIRHPKFKIKKIMVRTFITISIIIISFLFILVLIFK